MVISDSDLENIGQFIINELAKELIKQDHRATGKLISSLNYDTIQRSSSATLLINMEDYGKFVNTGRKRGAAKVPIDALVEWIKQKGIETNNKKVLGMAFAIQKTIQKEGIPTRNSRKRGKRIEFVNDTLERIDSIILSMIEAGVTKQLQASIDNLVKRT